MSKGERLGSKLDLHHFVGSFAFEDTASRSDGAAPVLHAIQG
jgi:hypothetical protein